MSVTFTAHVAHMHVYVRATVHVYTNTRAIAGTYVFVWRACAWWGHTRTRASSCDRNRNAKSRDPGVLSLARTPRSATISLGLVLSFARLEGRRALTANRVTSASRLCVSDALRHARTPPALESGIFIGRTKKRRAYSFFTCGQLAPSRSKWGCWALRSQRW